MQSLTSGYLLAIPHHYNQSTYAHLESCLTSLKWVKCRTDQQYLFCSFSPHLRFWHDQWGYLKRLFMGYFYTPFKVRSVVKLLKLENQFSRRAVKKAILDTYTQWNQHIANQNFRELEPMVSDLVMRKLRQKYAKIPLPPGSKPVLEQRGTNVKIINLVVAQIPDPINLHIVQATAKINSQTKYLLYGKDQQIIRGSEEFIPVEDTWVLEKIVEHPDDPWVVVSDRLEHPEDVAKANEGTATS